MTFLKDFITLLPKAVLPMIASDYIAKFPTVHRHKCLSTLRNKLKENNEEKSIKKSPHLQHLSLTHTKVPSGILRRYSGNSSTCRRPDGSALSGRVDLFCDHDKNCPIWIKNLLVTARTCRTSRFQSKISQKYVYAPDQGW